MKLSFDFDSHQNTDIYLKVTHFYLYDEEQYIIENYYYFLTTNHYIFQVYLNENVRKQYILSNDDEWH